jgi:hypothetical protein
MKRWLLSVVMLGALGCMTTAGPGLGKRLVIGRSVLGRPIVAWGFGHAGAATAPSELPHADVDFWRQQFESWW